METMTDRGPATVVNRLSGRTVRAEVREGRRIRPFELTSRDIEAETLMRLARKGYDWSNSLGNRRDAA